MPICTYTLMTDCVFTPQPNENCDKLLDREKLYLSILKKIAKIDNPREVCRQCSGTTVTLQGN
jgi:hypothetical protein